MKKLKVIPILALLFMLNVASMCSSDDSPTYTDLTSAQVINTATQGTWRITLFNDSGTDETNHFTGYDFAFGSGSLTTTNGTNTYTGTWSVSHDNSDDNPSDVDFNIFFASPPNFAELSEDWHLISYTATEIKLSHVSGGGGGTDYLTFTKN